MPTNNLTVTTFHHSISDSNGAQSQQAQRKSQNPVKTQGAKKPDIDTPVTAGAATPDAAATVFQAAVGAVGQLVVTTTVGALTVKRGIVTPEINALARVIYNLFLPCFLFCSVLTTVTTYGLQPSLALMPVAAAAQILVAYAASTAITRAAVAICGQPPCRWYCC